MHGRTDARTVGWTDGRTDGWKDRWAGGWTDIRMYIGTDAPPFLPKWAKKRIKIYSRVLLTQTDGQTDRQKDRQTEKYAYRARAREKQTVKKENTVISIGKQAKSNICERSLVLASAEMGRNVVKENPWRF